MRTLLIISRDTGLATALRSGLDARLWCVRTAPAVASAIGQTGPAMVDAVLLDAREGRPSTTVNRARQAFPDRPLIAVARDATSAEAALAAGATVTFASPLRPGLLQDWLSHQDFRQSTSQPAGQNSSTPSAPLPPPALNALENLARLAAVVSENLVPTSLAREFLLHIRSLVGVNRCAVYLRSETAEHDLFDCAHAVGRPADAVAATRLTLTSGIAAALSLHGRVLRRADADAAAVREFAEIGAEVALPILDRENLTGIVLLDARVTGEPFSPPELGLLFNAFEILGLALKRARHHAAIAAAEELAGDVFDTLDTACCVIGSDLSLLHFNPAARRLFGLTDESGVRELPAAIVSKIFAALRDGIAPPAFRHAPPGRDGRALDISIKQLPTAVLLVAEDVTEREDARRRDSANERREFVRSMAEHFAHEIGNTLVPLSTGQQLMASGDIDAEMMKGLESVFSNSVRRIERLTGQMQLLSRDALQDVADIPFAQLIDEAFTEARARAGNGDATLEIRGGADELTLHGERKALRQVFTEVLLNALQSASGHRQVCVAVRTTPSGDDLEIDVTDPGNGFSAEERAHATEPFYTSRAVGMGLGLAVARQIVELHGGALILQPGDAGFGGCVRLRFPISTVATD